MSTVISDLRQWGPDVAFPPSDLQFSERYTRSLAGSHYENFPVISWAVPRGLRQHFANVYAYCRWADDLGDETGSRERSLELLSWWRGELQRCYQGEADHPVFVALRSTIEQFSIPIDPFDDLISAFEQDQVVTSYETFDQLVDYCRRSANPVGRIVLHLIGSASARNLEWSDSICTGLQLANFWQDVERDQAIGRVYLPRNDRVEFGYSDEDLLAKRFNTEFRELMCFEVERTRQLLYSGKDLVAAVPGRWRIAIDLFMRGGLLILKEIEAIGFDVWETRPKVRKSQLISSGLRSAFAILSKRIPDENC